MTTATTTDLYRIEDIEVGTRFRKELGDLRALMASIEEVGLLHPIVITKEGKLLAGARRLRALQKLGWDEVPVTIAENVVDAAKELLAERDENTCRKDMKPSEAARLGIAIEALDAEKRLANQRASGRHLKQYKTADGKSTSPAELPYPGLGGAREKIGPAVGMSGPIYERAKVVVQAAEDEHAPAEVRQAAREAIAEMDRTGKITPNWRKVNRAKKAQPAPGEFASWDRSSQRYKDRIAKIIEGVWSSLNRFDVAAPGLAKVDIEALVENLSSEELEDMHEMAGNAVTGLKTFQRRLREHKPESKESQ